MGTWLAPDTLGKILGLGEAMDQQVFAATAAERLRPWIGDDTLLDLVDRVSKRAPVQDVRPLVAFVLDGWVNWTDDEQWQQPWPEPVKNAARGLASRFVHVDLEPILGRLAVQSPEEAAEKVAEILDEAADGDHDFVVAPCEGPGAYAVYVPETFRLYRVDAIWGTVQEGGKTAQERFIHLMNAPGPHHP